MRIAHIITRMIVGGAQENTLLCCEDLVGIFGDETVLITGPALGPEGDLLACSGGSEIDVRVIPSLRRSIHPLRDLRAYFQIKRMLREFRPDVVHTHSAKGGILGRLAAWSLGVQAVVHTVHGAPFHKYQRSSARAFCRWCEKAAARRCHHLISVADAMTDQLVTAGVAPRDKFTTVYSGMNVDPFLQANDNRAAVRNELGFTADQIVIGKIARLFHLKGHSYVIEAAERIVRRCPKVQFLFVGDGILRHDLELQILRAGLADHFHFTGLVDPSRIAPLIGAMDILVHTSLREGLARTLPQALIAGKPVVSYDVDGAREVVLPGETGYLLPARSIQPLADALIELATDGDRRQRFGQTGRERFTDQFRHDVMTRELRTIYEQLLG